jgi:hypothetical protein
MPTICTGPDRNGKPCSRPAKARGLCSGHLEQQRQGKPLTPLRVIHAERLVVFPVRVPEIVAERAAADPEGVRKVLVRWARRT